MASTSSCTRGRHPRLTLVNVAIAFGAGILSFLSPCVLPLVPAFLVDMAGEAALSGTQRARALVHAFAFVLGFSTVFTLLWIGVALVGSFAGGLGGAQRVARWLAAHIRVVNLAGGTLVIAMGLVLVSGQFARLPQLFNFLPLLG